VFSVRNSEQPRHMMFIPVKGNGGMAMKDGFLFANSNSSLLVMKLHDDSLYDIVKVIERRLYYMEDYYSPGPVGCGCGSYYATEAGGRTSGMSGSYATFAVIDSFLYYLDNGEIVTSDISDPGNPAELSRLYISNDIETIYPAEKNLFIGSSTGMHILSRSKPSSPSILGSVTHMRACDPVVARDSVAYVTLRSGNACGQTRDELMVIKMVDQIKPVVVKEIPVSTPYGMALKDTFLYVANGYYGYSLYSVANPVSPVKLKSFSTYTTVLDFIWDGMLLYILNTDNIAVYSVADPLLPMNLSNIYSTLIDDR